ncbi:MAG: hypothetical protein B7Z45_05555 [Azorhizobium sp. 12-66-6]|nr:MAG: hypothetical protein B7Z45_05555 [Azorhizobium sp. 12-66-6]
MWIAVDLALPNAGEDDTVQASDNLWKAVGTVAVADIVMSLDNVVAVAAVADGNWLLLGLGLAISIPLIVAGSSLVMAVLDRVPLLVWAGAALLGWVAGEMMVSDAGIADWIGGAAGAEHWARPAAAACAILVVGISWSVGTIRKRRAASEI